MNILPLLVKKGLVAEGDVAAIEKEAAEQGVAVEHILAEKGVAVDDIIEAKGEALNIPARRIGDATIPYEILQYVPEESASHYQFVPLGIDDGVLEVGVVDPDNIEALDALHFISTKANLPYKTFLISLEDFQRILGMYKGFSGEVGKALSELEVELSGGTKNEDEISIDTSTQTKSIEDQIKEEAPITKIVATMLRNAIEGGASDIHVEHMGDKVRVRFRVDGVLHTSITLPTTAHSGIVSRIKILCSMKLDEKRKPQDGRFSATIINRKVDFRVSTFPSSYGEKVVMRILDRQQSTFSLETVGLNEHYLKIIRTVIKQPYGMVLITGPTGSGKSTTLYGMLSEVDRQEKNAVSLEDPVEYSIEGVSQSQVRPEIGYTFANGLRSILRQDPDIIMVGEIRDKETAQLAVQAALTGHLVFSTLHTNNAIGAIPRLIDMGVDPFLIAPTLKLVIAQRLVRTLCPGTGKPIPVEGSLKALINEQFKDLPPDHAKEMPEIKNLHGIEPSGACPSGTRGRIGVFELFVMQREIEKMILDGSISEDKIWQVTRKSGMLTMKEDAIIKSSQKLVPFEEVNTLGVTLEDV